MLTATAFQLVFNVICLRSVPSFVRMEIQTHICQILDLPLITKVKD